MTEKMSESEKKRMIRMFTIACGFTFILAGLISFGSFVKQLLPIWFVFGAFAVAYAFEKKEPTDKMYLLMCAILIVQLFCFLFWL